jgi:Flp pilus assembly protein TadD
MTRTAKNSRLLALAAGTALASASLAGCATQSAPRADLSAGRAEVALKMGKTGDAIANAEAAVLADPRNAAYRTMLGAAYMEAGRFVAARTCFDDAMKLGDTSARTALGYALASTAVGDRSDALRVLSDWQDDIPAADLGLALALAGETGQAINVLSNAVRSGDNTPKSRQNLAYALALNGNWAGARIMAAEDVPADQLDARISEWARLAQPEAQATRVAALLGTTMVSDSGLPAQLALVNNPTAEQLAAEAAAYAQPVAEAALVAEVAVAGGELPPLDGPQSPMPVQDSPALAVAAPPVAPPRDFASAFAAPAPAGATPAQMMAAVAEFVSQPVVQQTPTRLGAAEPAPRPAPAYPTAGAPGGSHLVQLGSFSSEAGARRAWGIYAKRFPQLSAFDMVITKAEVRGKTYYRVSAGGLQRAEAGAVCSSVRRQGQGCYAWAEGRPMPGAISRATRMAAR